MHEEKCIIAADYRDGLPPCLQNDPVTMRMNSPSCAVNTNGPETARGI